MFFCLEAFHTPRDRTRPSSSTLRTPLLYVPHDKPGRQAAGGHPHLVSMGWGSCSPGPHLTVILRATPSSCEASSRIRWAILRGGPPSERGRDRWARTLLPETKWSCTAAVSFLRARRPCHTMGYFCSRGNKQSKLMPRGQSRAGYGPRQQLAGLIQVGIFGHFNTAQSLEGSGGRTAPRLTFRSWTMSTGLWEVKCGEESCLGEGWASVCSRANPGGVLGPEVVGTNNGCFGAA